MSSFDNATVVDTIADLRPVVENLLLLLSDKEKSVIVKRFNLDANRRFTLEEIGTEFSVTRERIRQIEKNALAKMKRNVFNTALKHLHEFYSSVVGEHGGFVKEEVLMAKLTKLMQESALIDESCVHLSLVLHEDLKCIGNTINFHPYVRANVLPDYSLKFVSNKLINQLHKHGDVKKVDKLHTELKPALDEVDFNMTKVKSLINIDKRLTLMDDGLVGLLEWRHIHPRTLREKILFIFRSENKPLHFTGISEKIEAAKFDTRSVNLQAVHNELIRHPQFILIGRGIYALDEWGYEKGTVSDVIEKLLKEKKEMSVEEIVEDVLSKRQIKKITILLSLKNNAKFVRVGRKRYKLA